MSGIPIMCSGCYIQLARLNLLRTLWEGFCYYPHFIEKRTEAQRSCATCLRSQGWKDAELTPNPERMASESVHDYSVLLPSMVVTQQIASLFRVNIDDLVFYPKVKQNRFWRHIFFFLFIGFSFEAFLAFSYKFPILLLNLSSLLSTEAVLICLSPKIS